MTKRSRTLSGEERHRLAADIADQLESRLGSLDGSTLEVHAGDEYFRMIRIGLRAKGASAVNPVKGLRIGTGLRRIEATKD